MAEKDDPKRIRYVILFLVLFACTVVAVRMVDGVQMQPWQLLLMLALLAATLASGAMAAAELLRRWMR